MSDERPEGRERRGASEGNDERGSSSSVRASTRRSTREPTSAAASSTVRTEAESSDVPRVPSEQRPVSSEVVRPEEDVETAEVGAEPERKTEEASVDDDDDEEEGS